jgi:hypothetical protein
VPPDRESLVLRDHDALVEQVLVRREEGVAFGREVDV